jgi:drug/metabolite transporter (DMT)-like permease
VLSGALAALGAALLWTVATRLFQEAGRGASPLELNLAKSLIGSLALALTLLVTLRGGGLPDGRALALLALSGALGIGVGDTAFFRALPALGTRRVLLAELLAAPVAAGGAWLLLGEGLTARGWTGLALTLAGVAGVVLRGDAAAGSDEARTALAAEDRRRHCALAWALVAALGQGGGISLSRLAMQGGTLDPALAALLRLLAGLVWILFLWRRGGARAEILSRRGRGRWGRVMAASLLGTWLGLWLQQAALARIPAGVTQTLLSTAPLFAMIFSRLAGRRQGAAAWAGALLAVAGVALLTGVL